MDNKKLNNYLFIPSSFKETTESASPKLQKGSKLKYFIALEEDVDGKTNEFPSGKVYQFIKDVPEKNKSK